MQIGDLFIPKGMNMELAMQAMNYDHEIWGADADRFIPERFGNGVSRACTPAHAFMPFATAPKFCGPGGQDWAGHAAPTLAVCAVSEL